MSSAWPSGEEIVIRSMPRWSSDDLLAVQAAVNSRPRKVLEWKTPAEVLDEQLRSLHEAAVATTGVETRQYTAIRYTDTLAGVAAVSSVGSRGDSYDNALAESTIGQIKTELIHRRGPWRTVEQLEFAVFEYLDWWNHRRLHGEIGLVPPAELEAHYYSQQHPIPEGSTL